MSKKYSSFALWIDSWSGYRCQNCGQWLANGQLPKSVVIALEDDKNSLADQAALQIPRGPIAYKNSIAQPCDFTFICLMPDPEVTVDLNSAQLSAQLPICWATWYWSSQEHPVVNAFPSNAPGEARASVVTDSGHHLYHEHLQRQQPAAENGCGRKITELQSQPQSLTTWSPSSTTSVES